MVIAIDAHNRVRVREFKGGVQRLNRDYRMLDNDGGGRDGGACQVAVDQLCGFSGWFRRLDGSREIYWVWFRLGGARGLEVPAAMLLLVEREGVGDGEGDHHGREQQCREDSHAE